MSGWVGIEISALQWLYRSSYVLQTVQSITLGKRLETTVTRKGQVTIPAELRKKHGIREGMRVDITDSPAGLLLKPVPDMNDWAGADKGKYSYLEMTERLDRLRQRWR